MKTVFKHLLMLVLAIITAVSCSDEHQLTVRNQASVNVNDEQTISEARAAHSEIIAELVDRSSTEGRGATSFRGKLSKSTEWDKARVVSLSVGRGVVVPLKFEQELYAKHPETGLGIPISSTTHLLVYKGKDQKMYSEVVTSMPDKEYFESATGRFTGTSIIEDWNGNFIKGYRYTQDGISTVTSNSQSSAGKVVCVITDWYNCVSVGGGTSSCNYSYSTSTCSDDGGGGGADGGGSGTGGGDYGGGGGGYGGGVDGDGDGFPDRAYSVYPDLDQTCPENFRFSVAVSDKLWLEAALLDVHATLATMIEH